MRRLDVILVVGEGESVCFSHRVVVLFHITLYQVDLTGIPYIHSVTSTLSFRYVRYHRLPGIG